MYSSYPTYAIPICLLLFFFFLSLMGSWCRGRAERGRERSGQLWLWSGWDLATWERKGRRRKKGEEVRVFKQ
jgi:hypothetical protein